MRQGTYDLALVPGRAVTVRAELRRGSMVLARVSRRIAPEADIAYEVHASTGPDDPTALCVGCGEVASAPVDPARPDGARLWLYTAFNGISRPLQL